MKITVESQKVGAMGPCRVRIYRNERVMARASDEGEWAGHPEGWRLYAEFEATEADEPRPGGGVTHYALLPEFTLEATNARGRGDCNRFDDVPRAVYTAVYEYAPGTYPEDAPGRSGFLPCFENLAAPESLGPRTTYAAVVRANMRPKAPRAEYWPEVLRG